MIFHVMQLSKYSITTLVTNSGNPMVLSGSSRTDLQESSASKQQVPVQRVQGSAREGQLCRVRV